MTIHEARVDPSPGAVGNLVWSLQDRPHRSGLAETMVDLLARLDRLCNRPGTE
jgi:hypothetical protein